MRAVITRTTDDVGGMTYFDDGVFAAWNEGRSSRVLIIGQHHSYWVPACDGQDPYLKALDADPGTVSGMTDTEEVLWQVLRGVYF